MPLSNHLLDISEGQLYVHVQSGVTLFRDVLNSVFDQDLASHLPTRVLPISTSPPTDLATLFDWEVADGVMRLNDAGYIVAESWQWLGMQYDYMELSEWVIMPKHMHGIIVVTDGRGGSRTAPTVKRKPIGRIIGAFKTVSTKRINELRSTPGVAVWQRNYYERIIRDESSLNRMRQYILDNPLRWQVDRENPDAAEPDPKEAWLA